MDYFNDAEKAFLSDLVAICAKHKVIMMVDVSRADHDGECPILCQFGPDYGTNGEFEISIVDGDSVRYVVTKVCDFRPELEEQAHG